MRLDLPSHPAEHDKPFPSFRQPAIVGSFSLDRDRTFRPDRSEPQH